MSLMVLDSADQRTLEATIPVQHRKAKTVDYSGSSPLEADDKTLLRRCRQGDEQSFRKLVYRYQKRVFSIAFGMLHNTEDALDIVQEAFIKVHRHLEKFHGTSSFYTWLYRIVVNLCIDFLRREGRHTSMDYDDTIQHQEECLQGDTSLLRGIPQGDPVKVLQNKELGEQIMMGVERLSANHRAVILLREVEGLSYEEIARVMQCSKGTVMSRLHHARSNLRKYLRGYLFWEEGRGERGEEERERQKNKEEN